jgi:hypothetical protein
MGDKQKLIAVIMKLLETYRPEYKSGRAARKAVMPAMVAVSHH